MRYITGRVIDLDAKERKGDNEEKERKKEPFGVEKEPKEEENDRRNGGRIKYRY